MKTKLKMRRKTLVSALFVLFIVSIIPVLADEGAEVDLTATVAGDSAEVDLTVTVVRPPVAARARPNTEPIANAGPNQKAWVGHTVYFNGSKSRDPDGYLINYEWDFGDEKTASGVAVEHEYAEPDQYNVTLTVKDDRWSYDSDSCKVKISEPPTDVSAEFAERVRTREHVVDAMDDANTTVTLNTTDDVTVTVLRYEENPYPGDPIPAMALPTYVDVEVSDPDAVVWPIYVEMFYTDEEVAGLDETTFGIYYWFNGTWQRCSDTGVDTERNVVWAYMTAEEASGSPILIAGMHAITPPPLPPIISNLIITPNELELGDEVTINFDIENYGSQSQTYGVAIHIENVNDPPSTWPPYDVTMTTWVDLEAYEFKTVFFTITMDTVGDFNVTVSGMTASFKVGTWPPPTPPRPAEFELSDLIISPEEVEPGDEVTISVLVTNIGEETGDYTVTLGVENIIAIMSEEEVTLEGGESKTVPFAFTMNTEGTYQVEVDGLTGSFTVKALPKPAEFEVSNLIISPEEVEEGEAVTVSVDVTNVGEETGDYTINLDLPAGPYLREKTVSLEGGESERVEFEVSRDIAGTYAVTVNGITGSFTVTEPPTVPVWWMRPGYMAGILILVASAGAVIYYAWKAKLFSPISSDST